jgi:hypothetical protein
VGQKGRATRTASTLALGQLRVYLVPRHRPGPTLNLIPAAVRCIARIPAVHRIAIERLGSTFILAPTDNRACPNADNRECHLEPRVWSMEAALVVIARPRSSWTRLSRRRREAAELVLDHPGKGDRRPVFEIAADDLDSNR